MNGWLHAFTQASHCTQVRESAVERDAARTCADEAGAGIVYVLYSELASHNYAPRACPRLLAIPSVARNLFVKTI